MKLVEPSLEYRQPYLDMLAAWDKIEDYRTQSPFPLSFETSDFDLFLNQIEDLKYRPASGMVPSTTYWLIDDDGQVVAVSNLRHTLNSNLEKMGGHIGYGTRADKRRMGYATQILAKTLEKANQMGITRALVTCSPDNIGSNKVILNNQGIWQDEIEVDGKKLNRYWIETSLRGIEKSK